MGTSIDPIDGFIVHRGSTNVLDLVGLIDETTLDYPVDATVTATVTDVSGVDIVGAVDLVCAYVPNTTKPNTIYRAMLPYTVDLPDALYYVTFTILKLGVKREIIKKLVPVDG